MVVVRTVVSAQRYILILKRQRSEGEGGRNIMDGRTEVPTAPNISTISNRTDPGLASHVVKHAFGFGLDIWQNLDAG